jgi:hypothetical protein
MLRRIKSFLSHKWNVFFSIFTSFLFCILSPNQTYILNIANFGQSKSDKTIHYIAI